MSTRSMIALALNDTMLDPALTNYKVIRCHYDGYLLDGVGVTLLKNYKTYTQIEEMINLGDLLYLGNTLDSNDTIAFIRDRNEDKEFCAPIEFNTEADSFETAFQQLLDEFKKSDAEFLYIYQENIWWVLDKHIMKQNNFRVIYQINQLKAAILDELILEGIIKTF